MTNTGENVRQTPQERVCGPIRAGHEQDTASDGTGPQIGPEGTMEMDSIDALRDWWRDRFPVMDARLGSEFRWRIDAIEREAKADRVDAYTKGYDEGFASADDWAAQHEDAMAEHGWVRLPLDAEGVPIHVGDVMEWVDIDGEVEVVCTVDAVGVDCFFAWDAANCRYAQKHANAYRHHHAPTVEDVLREFTDEVWDRCCEGATASDSGIDELVAEYAAKLRLAGDE